MLRVAINGFGRIGRMVLRAIYENQYKGLKVVAINNRAKPETSAFLLERDTIHGKFNFNIKYTKDEIIVGKDKIQCYHESDPINCPWDEEKIDIVFECTGQFNSKEDSYKHIEAGAKKVIVSAPCKEADQTVVYGVNEKVISKKDKVISVASCTTNCLAPMAKVLNDSFGIEKGLMTTIHGYTNDQRILDLPHSDLRRARAAAENIIPTTTGAAKAVGKIIPELNGKVNGMAVRVPVKCGSLNDFVCVLKKKATVEEINSAFKKSAAGELKGIMEYTEDPIVSVDILDNPHSCIFDALSTMVISDNLVKITGWYDNEWGYSNRVVDLIGLLDK